NGQRTTPQKKEPPCGGSLSDQCGSGAISERFVCLADPFVAGVQSRLRLVHQNQGFERIFAEFANGLLVKLGVHFGVPLCCCGEMNVARSPRRAQPLLLSGPRVGGAPLIPCPLPAPLMAFRTTVQLTQNTNFSRNCTTCSACPGLTSAGHCLNAS